MGVCEIARSCQRGMHWQQQQHPERYVGPSAYDPSRDLSPNLPSDRRTSMGDIDSSYTTTTTNNNNHHLCATVPCSLRRSANNNFEGQSCIYQNRTTPPVYEHVRTSPNYCKYTSVSPSSCAYKRVPSPTDKPAEEDFKPNIKCDFDIIKYNEQDRLSSETSDSSIGPKTETPSTTPRADDCAGCGRKITDRFYLLAVDRKWHAACLQCCQCRSGLDGEVTCFTRQGNIYCKKDYYRLFVMKRCARCQAAISSSELVMRARELVFHVPCFSCSVCNITLTKGDHFGLRGGAVLCRQHYDLSNNNSPDDYHHPSFTSSEYHHHHHHSSPLPLPQPPGPSPTESLIANKASFFNGATTAAPRQKGRPRKRKPKDLESMTANLDLNDSYLDFGRGPGTPGMSNSGRSKRMRTSFKHHQLRTMKSYFSINHNPDAKDLKQLSQKTSLPKRVLQVWFQNARAKWRRMMVKQEGKSDKCSDSGGLSDLETYPSHSGNLSLGGQHSPTYMLSTSSPSSLDCS